MSQLQYERCETDGGFEDHHMTVPLGNDYFIDVVVSFPDGANETCDLEVTQNIKGVRGKTVITTIPYIDGEQIVYDAQRASGRY